MKRINRIIFLFLLFYNFLGGAFSQVLTETQARTELGRINKVFDSASYLGFDVDMTLSSDTVLGYSESDHELTKYVLNKGNMYFMISNIEFIQNDTISMSIYNEEKQIFIDRKSTKENSSVFPLREFTDSTLSYLFNYYNNSYTFNEGIATLTFTTDSLNMPYKSFSVEYDSTSYILTSLSMTFSQAVEELKESDSSMVNHPILSKTLKLNFANYHFAEDLGVLDPGKYLFFDRVRMEYRGREKYKGYQVLGSNLGNSQLIHNDIEQPAPYEEEEQ